VPARGVDDDAPAAREAHVVDRSGDPLIRAEAVWKLFGANAARVVGTPDASCRGRSCRPGPAASRPSAT
jgi:hypothetical protein